jgi:hypothetical protein
MKAVKKMLIKWRIKGIFWNYPSVISLPCNVTAKITTYYWPALNLSVFRTSQNLHPMCIGLYFNISLITLFRRFAVRVRNLSLTSSRTSIWEIGCRWVIVLDFKLTPCPEWRMLASGCFTGDCSLNVIVSELLYFLPTRLLGWNTQIVPKRWYLNYRRRRNTQKKAYRIIVAVNCIAFYSFSTSAVYV